MSQDNKVTSLNIRTILVLCRSPGIHHHLLCKAYQGWFVLWHHLPVPQLVFAAIRLLVACSVQVWGFLLLVLLGWLGCRQQDSG